ncbi:MAG: type II toxin-antitoxin system death-on-curing family toxin [Anaerovibrio sp.]|nr:type II toxin-antitoxin system death-on-curing family toxin [Anaerovibrio sp.]
MYFTEILLKDVLNFHNDLENSDIPVEKGVRDIALLESAINTPFQTFDGEDLFKTIQDKAARLLCGIISNHAFIDGNKRTAIHAMEIFLIINGYTIQYEDEDMEQLVVEIASGSINFEQASQWIKNHLDS